jgi:hypothetical protein
MTEIPTTGSRGQPLKMAQYLAEGKRLAALVNDYRAAKGEAPDTQHEGSFVKCNEAPTPTKRKSYPLPRLDQPTEIPGYPLNPSPAQDIPDYGNIGRVKAIRATQAARRGKKAPVTPIGPSELRKRGQ